MVKFKVMHISTVNISNRVTDKANITMAITYEVAYGLSTSMHVTTETDIIQSFFA